MKFASFTLLLAASAGTVDGFCCTAPHPRVNTAVYGFNFNNNQERDQLERYQQAMREMNGGYSVPDWERKFGSVNSLRDGKRDVQYPNGISRDNLYNNNNRGGNAIYAGMPGTANPYMNRKSNYGGDPDVMPLIPDQDDRVQRTSSIFPPSNAAPRRQETFMGQSYGQGNAPGNARPSYYQRPSSVYEDRRQMVEPPQPKPGTNIFGQRKENKNPFQGYTPRALPQARNPEYVPLNLEPERPREQRDRARSQFNREGFGVGSLANDFNNRNGENRNDFRNQGVVPSDMTAERIERRNRNLDALGGAYNNGDKNAIFVEPDNNARRNPMFNNLGNRNRNTVGNTQNPFVNRGDTQNPFVNNNRNNGGIRNGRADSDRNYNINRDVRNNLDRKPLVLEPEPFPRNVNRNENRRVNSIGQRPPKNDGVPFGVQEQQRRKRRNFFPQYENTPLRNEGPRLNGMRGSNSTFNRSDNPFNEGSFVSEGRIVGRTPGMGGPPRGDGLPPPGDRRESVYYVDGQRMTEFDRRKPRKKGNGVANLAAALFVGLPLSFLVGPQYLDKYPALKDNLPKSVVEFSKNAQKSMKKTGFDFNLPKTNIPAGGVLKEKIKANNDGGSNKAAAKPAAASAPKPAPAPAPAPAKPKLTPEEIEKQLNAVKAPAAAPAPSKLTQEEILRQLNDVKVGYNPQVDNSQLQAPQYTQQQYDEAYAIAVQKLQQQQQQQLNNAYSSFVSADSGASQQQQQYADAYVGADSTQQQQYMDAYTTAYNAHVATQQQYSETNAVGDNMQPQQTEQQYADGNQAFVAPDSGAVQQPYQEAYTSQAADYAQQQYTQAYNAYVSAQSDATQQQSLQYVDPSYSQQQQEQENTQQQPYYEDERYTVQQQQQYQEGQQTSFDDYSMF